MHFQFSKQRLTTYVSTKSNEYIH